MTRKQGRHWSRQVSMPTIRRTVGAGFHCGPSILSRFPATTIACVKNLMCRIWRRPSMPLLREHSRPLLSISKRPLKCSNKPIPTKPNLGVTMRLFTFMMKYSRGIVVLSIIAGLISGAANTGLVALVHNILQVGKNRPEFFVLAYIGLCLLLPLARFSSQILLTHLSQKAIFELRLQMSRQILAAPLRRLEEVGSARIMSSLTDDIFIITNTLSSIPVLCMQVAVVVGCLVYMAWLSWT